MAVLANKKGTGFFHQVSNRIEGTVPFYDSNFEHATGVVRSKSAKPNMPLSAQLTDLELSEEELGNDEDIDRSDAVLWGNSVSPNRSEIAKRMKVADKLTALATDMIGMAGGSGLATQVQLLKREMVSARRVLRSCRSERNYLSVIFTVEAALQNVRWIDLTVPLLKQIKQSLEVGRSSGEISFDEMNRQAKKLRGIGVSTFPVFDFDDDEES